MPIPIANRKSKIANLAPPLSSSRQLCNNNGFAAAERPDNTKPAATGFLRGNVSMGPTNVALVKLLQADQALRAAQGRLDSASRSVRVQERRIAELSEKLKLTQQQLREQQARGGELDLDMKTRDARIEKLRTQQQDSKNHKEYQAFLTEINTEKIDKGKLEEEWLKVMEGVEILQKEVKTFHEQVDAEKKAHEHTKHQLSGKLSQLQAEVDRLKPIRDEAARATPPTGLNAFERLADRYEGEAMAALGKPDRRREEYICNSCNMSLVADIYNRLHSRDELVICPNCRRMLYIPDELPPELAINTKPPRKAVTASTEADE
ncbi:MAG TPA: C4-type zinc ribbon domain-containing protein [Tepidisphaeraceae bacterium]|nr:C4-type zinc ribbon domain-containing protein [Tepidisphaeraceae bacterium]